MNRGILYMVGFCMSICFCIPLQSQSFSFRNISIEEGLASSETYKIIQDHNGYIWIATDAGLCKYNGKTFEIFTVANGLPSNTIFEVMEDKYGRIWGAGFYGGIFYILGNKVYTIGANPFLTQQGKIKKEIIRKLALDSLDVLHVGTNQSYYEILPAQNYSEIKAQYAGDSSFTYIEEIGGELVFSRLVSPGCKAGSGKYLLKKNQQTTTLYFPYEDPKLVIPATFFAITHPQLGYFLIRGYDLMYLGPKGKILKTFTNPINTLYVDKGLNLWVGCENIGFYRFAGGDLNSTPQHGFSGFSVSSFCEDLEGGLWICTTNNGVYYCPTTRMFEVDQLKEKNVVGIEQVDNQLYAGNSVNQAYRWKDDSLTLLFPEKSTSRVDRMHFYEQNHWLYKTGAFMSAINTQGNFKYVNSKTNGLVQIRQVAMHLGKMVGITHSTIFNINNDEVDTSVALPSRGFSLYTSHSGKLLAGCMDGLYVVNDFKFSLVKLLDDTSAVRISYITEDRQGHLMVTSKNRGVFILLKQGWFNLNESMGLPSNICNHIFESSMGDYYISTNKGLCRIVYNQGKLAIETMDMSNGLPTNEINAVEEFEGNLYIATKRGLCYYSLSNSIYNRTPPPLDITRFMLSNKKLENKASYTYSENDLVFQANVLSFQNPSINSIKYRLFPVDSAFKTSNFLTFNYDNLPPGNYTLSISAVNNNGIESSPTIYQFTITRPFWKTTWFLVLMIGGGLAFIMAMVYAITQRIKARETEKTFLKQKILEFHYTALRAQMSPHFIFNIINSIQLFVLNNQPRDAYNYLSKFSRLIRRVLDNASENLSLLEDELKTIELYMELEQIRLEKQLIFTTTLSPEVEASKMYVPSMIIQPLLENAIWHGIFPIYKTTQGKIHLRLDIENNEVLVITVKDNGVGFKKEPAVNHNQDKTKSLGLTLIKDRLAILSPQASIVISNLMNEEDEIQGTEVVVKFPIIKKK
jgi:ligand-binding sensor domain-containing protein